MLFVIGFKPIQTANYKSLIFNDLSIIAEPTYNYYNYYYCDYC